MNHNLGLHPVITLLSITALFALLGPVGGVLAVPLAALVQIIFLRWVFRTGGLQDPSTSPSELRDRRGVLLYRTERLRHDLHALMSDRAGGSNMDPLEEAEEGIESVLQCLEEILQPAHAREASA
jgi:hypothetical protein